MTFETHYARVSNEHLKDILDRVDEEENLLNTTINQHIKKLDLHLPTLPSRYIQLLTKYSPAQLSLSVTLYDVDMHDWI